VLRRWDDLARRRSVQRMVELSVALATGSLEESRTGKSYQIHRAGAPVRVERQVLAIVQNLAVPFDRRDWLRCQALVSAGYQFAVGRRKGRMTAGARMHEQAGGR
jgi:hypothetical protein